MARAISFYYKSELILINSRRFTGLSLCVISRFSSLTAFYNSSLFPTRIEAESTY